MKNKNKNKLTCTMNPRPEVDFILSLRIITYKIFIYKMETRNQID